MVSKTNENRIEPIGTKYLILSIVVIQEYLKKEISDE